MRKKYETRKIKQKKSSLKIYSEGIFKNISENKFVLNVLILYCCSILTETISEEERKRSSQKLASDV